MSGRGKGIQGLGKGGARRHRRVLGDSIQGIKNGSIRKLARRAGIRRISNTLYAIVRELLEKYLRQILRDALMYRNSAKRRTVLITDITNSLTKNGRMLYGYKHS